ncbi:MAG: hypothetical protein JST54_13445 [Deltaproteobacteria bacterium]|nr:hypothetical protein [Deltaproteobacteria bacterium]
MPPVDPVPVVPEPAVPGPELVDAVPLMLETPPVEPWVPPEPLPEVAFVVTPLEDVVPELLPDVSDELVRQPA